MSADAVVVAVDAGPLHGPLSGVGTATAGLLAGLRDQPSVEVVRYVLSARAALQPGMRRLPLPAGIAHRVWARASLPRVDRWLRPAQVIHGTNYVVPPSRLPRLVSVYDCWFLRHPESVGPVVARAGEVLRRAVRNGAVVHASSAATAAEVRALLGTSRVHVVPLGAPEATGAAAAARPVDAVAGRRFVLALGTTERRKNLPALVRAFARLPVPPAAEIDLVIAGGDGDDLPAIREAMRALPDAGRVHLLGRVDDGAKAWLLANTAVLAYPSVDEGFGFPLLEAMAAGAPIVASRAGSIPEVAGDAALLVDPADVDGLATALARVLTDDALRTRLMAAGRTQLTAFDWRETAKAMAALYHALAAGDA
jgi:glycosyltransferase involved in cell wall biosynthesis